MRQHPNSYSGNIQPSEGTIFVFGSNNCGMHIGGSAKVAVDKFGAEYGNPYGLQGNSYALCTTDFKNRGKLYSLEKIVKHIEELFDTCEDIPQYDYKVAYRNQPDEVTLCGYSGQDLMDCFYDVATRYGGYPDNLYFSEEWVNSGRLDLD